ncbi:hypothetical protein [Jeotgalibacillus marinus]|uniref:Uncharacterized protein n=1 Tax=Jeotgalibacillus marinus TaxID=86667 RepID=A0ABV3Q8Z9_9BACL
MLTRLQQKFKDVPNVFEEDCEMWLEDALAIHGAEVEVEIEEKERPLILMLAQSLGSRDISLRVSHYFKYEDGEESVDKTLIAEQYRAIANEFYDSYMRIKEHVAG